MTCETLYKPKGAGHGAPEDKGRKYTASNISDQLKGFIDYVLSGKIRDEERESHPGEYRNSFTILMERLPDWKHVTADELHMAASFYLNNPKWGTNFRKVYPGLGMVLSAAYNKFGIRDIVFDVEVDGLYEPGVRNLDGIDSLGYYLWEGGRLIKRTGRGFHIGEVSEGTVINYDTTSTLGMESSGLTINFGHIYMHVGHNTSGVAVNLGHTNEWFGSSDKKGILINWGNEPMVRKNAYPVLYHEFCERIPGLVDYLEWMKEALGPDRPDEEVFKALDEHDMKGDIRKLVEEGGWFEWGRGVKS